MKMVKIWHFREIFDFYPILDCDTVRTSTDVENPNRKSLDLHLHIIYPKKLLLS